MDLVLPPAAVAGAMSPELAEAALVVGAALPYADENTTFISQLLCRVPPGASIHVLVCYVRHVSIPYQPGVF